MVQDVIERRVVTYPALPTGMTYQQFVDLWLRRYKASTRETYKSAAYRFLFFLEEKRRDKAGSGHRRSAARLRGEPELPGRCD